MTALGASLDGLAAPQHIEYALQLTLGAVFLLSAVPKVRHPARFARTITDYGIVGPGLARVGAATVIAVEGFLAVSLLSGALFEVGLALSAVTLAAFGGVTARNLRQERDVPCGCFGDADERVSKTGLARISLLLLALAAVVAILATGEATAITAHDLWDDGGSSALRYLVDVGAVAAALMLTAALALRGRELRPLLGYLRTSPHRSSSPRSSPERGSA